VLARACGGLAVVETVHEILGRERHTQPLPEDVFVAQGAAATEGTGAGHGLTVAVGPSIRGRISPRLTSGDFPLAWRSSMII
jgi:hypothetical protein